jgi:hypothetical protein
MPAQRGKPGDAREGLKVGDKPLEYNMAAPRRRYAEVVGMLAKAQPLCVGADAEPIGKVPRAPGHSPRQRIHR